ncbi:hypothetical protein [Clostridium vincentii]|uniref:Uncharacterized protein n=1 Tax=Clostridium vincentii TaxID=52704 RepID=A0A2T0B8I4_9CLOT|nr:hypothetical protein [Clostridium vincentii]PRR80208.1 hypothetical protein CLVI_31100 [Clostridium vincentii]
MREYESRILAMGTLVDYNEKSITFSKKGQSIDLGAIEKSYAADRGNITENTV